MSDLAEQLKAVKLRKSKEPTKDYSDPKLAGFVTKSEIQAYQSKVLDCNIENWYESIKDQTFKTEFCPILFEDAKLFVQIYEKLFKDKDPEYLIQLTDWRELLDDEEKNHILNLEERLQKSIESFINTQDHVFVKTSSRSAKDSPLASKNFKQVYLKNLDQLKESDKENENEQLICMLKSAFECLKVSNSIQVIEMFIKSERIYQDMLLAIEKKERFNENFIIREFIDIDVDMEFRGFVFNNKLTALSQYNYLIYSKRLNDEKRLIQDKILSFFENQVLPKLVSTKFLNSFVIDFAILSNSQVVVIEINPFLETTDAALFSWQHERNLIENTNNFCFRITERSKPGAKAMLPYSLRKLIDK